MEGERNREHFINWEALLKRPGLIENLAGDICRKNFPDYAKKTSQELVSAFKEDRDLVKIPIPEGYVDLYNQLGNFSTLEGLKKYCNNHDLQFLTEQELENFASTYMEVMEMDLGDDEKNNNSSNLKVN